MASASEDPSMSALSVILEKIGALQEELKEAEVAVSNQPGYEDHDDDEMVSKATKKIRAEYYQLTKETSYLKKSAPEGLPEDEEFQYFLAVAELQRNIEELKAYAALSEKNVRFVLDQVQMTQNLILNEEGLSELLNKKKSAAAADALQDHSKSDQEQQIERKLRGTKIVYKELKIFIGEMLEKVFQDDKSAGGGERPLLGQFIQSLWNVFLQEGPDKYLKMSHLEHDVAPTDVTWLKDYGIIETNPEDKDQVRLLNFTE